MGTVQAIREGLSFALGEGAKGLPYALLLARLLPPLTPKDPSQGRFIPSSSLGAEAIKTAGFFALFCAARAWRARVNEYVPRPYLVSGSPPSGHKTER
jgi:alpha-1,2-glucosyltransferase